MSNALNLNDIVTVNPNMSRKYGGMRLKITKPPVGARGVNYVAQALDSAQTVRGPREAFLLAGDAPASTIVKTPFIGFSEGELVKVAGRSELFVVIRQSAKSVTVTQLGGGRGLYVRPAGLTKVDPSDVLK